MATDIENRLTFQAAALATMGDCPKWDAAVEQYLRAELLGHADNVFGAQAAANNNWLLCSKRADCEAQDAAANAASNADDIWAEKFGKPFWNAGRILAGTPAPNLRAALFKAFVIERDELFLDTEFPGDCMQIIERDLAGGSDA